MTYDEPDLAAVRSTLSARVAHQEASLSRSWDTISDRLAEPAVVAAPVRAEPARPARRGSRWLVPAAAAASVAALAVGAVVALGGGDTAGGTEFAAEPEAADVLEALAVAAEGSEQAEIGPGQLVYLQLSGKEWLADGSVHATYTGESWHDPADGMRLVKLITDGDSDEGWQRDVAVLPPSQYEHGPSAASEPGAWATSPTPENLAALPLDPQQLAAELRAVPPPIGAAVTDESYLLWETVSTFFYWKAEPLLSPELRAALLRAFADVDGLAAREVTVDGRTLIGLRYASVVPSGELTSQELLFDPETGSAVGAQVFSSPSATPDAPPLDADLRVHRTYGWAIVDGLDQRN